MVAKKKSTARTARATKKAATKSSTKKSAVEPEVDPACREVVAEYFDVTGKTLAAQVAQCQEIAEAVREGDYTSEEAQRDWQAYLERTSEYCREVGRLYVDGWSKCTPMSWVSPSWVSPCWGQPENGSKS